MGNSIPSLNFLRVKEPLKSHQRGHPKPLGLDIFEQPYESILDTQEFLQMTGPMIAEILWGRSRPVGLRNTMGQILTYPDSFQKPAVWESLLPLTGDFGLREIRLTTDILSTSLRQRICIWHTRVRTLDIQE